MPNHLDEIIQAYATTFQDTTFGRAEKQRLKKLLASYRPSQRERDLLRSKIFDIARTGLADKPAPAIINWLETANKTLLDRKGQDFDTRVYFSPGDDCRHAIQHHLRSAINVVKICVFTISDDRISQAISDCHHRGVTVRIITDNDKLYDMGSDVDRLSQEGIDIRIDQTSHHMHHKFAIFDNTTVLTGSYNWTRSAARHNHENLLLTDDKRVVASFGKSFDALWHEVVPYG